MRDTIIQQSLMSVWRENVEMSERMNILENARKHSSSAEDSYRYTLTLSKGDNTEIFIYEHGVLVGYTLKQYNGYPVLLDEEELEPAGIVIKKRNKN